MIDIPGRRIEVSEEVYTEWFPRGGDSIIIRGQVIDFDATPSVVVQAFSKNSDDTGVGGAVSGCLITLGTSKGTIIETFYTSPNATGGGGIGELVRFKISCTGASSWSLFRLFPPIFFDKSA